MVLAFTDATSNTATGDAAKSAPIIGNRDPMCSLCVRVIPSYWSVVILPNARRFAAEDNHGPILFELQPTGR